MKIYLFSLAIKLLLSNFHQRSSSKTYLPRSISSTIEKVVFQSSRILLISYCHFIFRISSSLVEAISQWSPQTLIIRALLASAHLINFPLHLSHFCCCCGFACLVVGFFLQGLGLFIYLLYIRTAFDCYLKLLGQLIP